MLIVLYTNVDDQCDELVTVVGQIELKTAATVDMPWQNFSKFRVWDKVPEGSTISFGDAQIPIQLAAMLRWFTAGGAIRIALRQLPQTWKLRH